MLRLGIHTVPAVSFNIFVRSDYDGFVGTPFSVDQMIVMTQALLNDGFSKDDIELIMGKNVVSLLRNHLPSSIN